MTVSGTGGRGPASGRPATSVLPPTQAALRFALEVGALVCWGVVGWSVTDGPLRWVLVVALPVAGATAWAVFRTPGDESAGGTAPCPSPAASGSAWS